MIWTRSAIFNVTAIMSSFDPKTSVLRDADGITVKTDSETLRLDVISDEIIRVRATSLDPLPVYQSMMVPGNCHDQVDWEWNETDEYVSLRTTCLRVQVEKNSGRVSFFDATGNRLLEETEGDRDMTPVVEMGEATFRVSQQFDAQHVKCVNGLGGHQNGIINFKGKDVLLRQYNVVVAIPFFLTDARFGVLWDNPSITHYGDPRDFAALSTLKLYDAEGRPGALTADYYNDPACREAFHTRRESEIGYEFISDLKHAPEGFDFKVGTIVWTGEIEATETGVHRFLSYGSSYIKIWIDSCLVVDSWRQDWMPWTSEFEFSMQPGQRHTIKVEWTCDKGYCSLRCLGPTPQELKERITLTSEIGEQINYYFIHGETPDTIIANYRLLTGQAPMPPKWAMGLWQSRERYKTQEELLEAVREHRRRGIPLDGIVQDWQYWRNGQWGSHEFDPERFPDPATMMDEVHRDLNARLMISVWPKFHTDTEHFKQFRERGWLYLRNVEVGDKDSEDCCSTFYDAFNETAGRAFWKQLETKLFNKGVDAWWLDATEPDIHPNISFTERKLRMHPTACGNGARHFNAYSIHHCRWVYEGQRNTDSSRRVFILTRSALPGQQRYGAATWSGDVATRWIDLKNQIPASLNFCAAGIPYWTTDIGGFSVEKRYEQAQGEDLDEFREIHMRWYQFGVFNPLFRIHGQFPFREIYNLSPEGHPIYESMVAYDKLRYRLLPYIYSLCAKVTMGGYTLMRPLMMDFPQDETAFEIADQFMFGPAFLVCPVTDYKARTRSVYLPKGYAWYDFYSGKALTGGIRIEADAPLTQIPLYIKAGTILTFGPDLQYTGEKPADPIEIRVYPGNDGLFVLYEDNGVDYEYEKGAFSEIPIRWENATRTLTLDPRKGEFPGMLARRVFRIVDASRHPDCGIESTAVADQIVEYHGDSLEVKL